MEQSNDITELTKALAEFRKIVKQPTKSGGGHFGNYVELESVIKSIDEAAGANDISYVQEATSDDNVVNVATQIMHKSGQWIRFAPMSIPASRRDAQQFGSAESYARRYALSAVFGISSDKDDDGQAATDGVNNQPTKAPKSKRSAAETAYNTEYAEMIKVVGKEGAKKANTAALGLAGVAPDEKPTEAQLAQAKTFLHNMRMEKQEATA